MKSFPSDYTRFLKNRECAIQPGSTKAHLENLIEHRCATADYKNIYCQIPEDAKSTFLTEFSPNGKLVASTHGDHKIYVCEIATGRLLHTLVGHPRTPWCIAFHPSSNDILASGCLGGEVRVWDLHGGSEVWVAHKNYVITSLAFHPLDKVLVIATHNALHFWDWSKPKPFATCATATEREKVRYVKFNSLGTRLITGISNLPPESSMSASRCRVIDALCAGRTRPPTTSSQNSPIGNNQNHTSSSSSLPQQEGSRNSLSNNTDESEWNHFSLPFQEELNEVPLQNMIRQMINLREMYRLFPSSGGELAASNPEEAIARAREYAEAVTLSTHRIMGLADSHFPDSLSSERMMEEEDELGGGEQARIAEPPLPPETSSGTTGLSDDFWLTFFRLRLLCTQMEQQIQQETTNAAESSQPASQGSSSSSLRYRRPSTCSSMWRVQEELETSVVSLLTRLQQSLASLHLASTFARSQILQVRLHIREILVKLTAEGRARRRRRQLANLDAAQGESCPVSTDRVHSQRCAVCVPPAGVQPTWDPQYCLWLLESSIQLTRQMQNILVADQRLSQLRSAPLAHDDLLGSRLPPSQSGQHPTAHSATSETNDTTRQLDHEESSLSRRLRFRRFRHLVASSNLHMPHALNQATPARTNAESITRWPAPRRARPSSTSTGLFTRILRVHCPSENDSSPENPEASPSQSRTYTQDSYSRMMSARHSLLNRMQNLRHQLYNTMDTTPPSDESLHMDDLVLGDTQSSSSSPPSWPIFLSSWISRRRVRSPPFLFHPVGEPSYGELRSNPVSFWSESFHSPYASLFFEPSIRARIPTMMGIVENHPNLTHRIQCWDFSNFTIPNIANTKTNVALARCRIHNDGSVALSSCGLRLAALVPGARGAVVVTVVSLEPKTLGQCLHTWRAGFNVVSLSLSPLGRYLLVGLAGLSPHLLYMDDAVPGSHHSCTPTVARIFHLDPDESGLISVRELTRPLHHSSIGARLSGGVNIIRWLPVPGQGFVYGTNRGTVTICHPIRSRSLFQPEANLQMHATTATQTSEPQTNTTGTQTTSASISSALW